MSPYNLLVVIIFTLTIPEHFSSANNCLSIKPVKDFQLEKSLGRWYVVAHASSKFLVSLSCSYCDFAVKPSEPNEIEVKCSSIDAADNDTIDAAIHLTFAAAPDVPVFLETLHEGKLENVMLNKIIATDYDTYEMHCSSSNKKGSRAALYVISRKRNVDAPFVAKMYEILAELGLGKPRLTMCKQQDCPN